MIIKNCFLIFLQLITLSLGASTVDVTPESQKYGNRLYEGRHAQAAEFPFMVALILKDSVNNINRIYCGGALIDMYHVVTGGQCFPLNTAIDNITVAAGLTNLKQVSSTRPNYIQTRSIEAVVLHENFILMTINKKLIEIKNDIAILRVKKPFTFNKYVKKIDIPNQSVKPNTKCKFVGWGQTKSTSNTQGYDKEILNVTSNGVVIYPFDLITAEFTVASDYKCRQYHNKGRRALLYDSRIMLCAGYPLGTDTSSSCRGDSGSPLVCDNVLHGIDSVGARLCVKDAKSNPTLFTKIHKFNDWISKTVADLTKKFAS